MSENDVNSYHDVTSFVPILAHVMACYYVQRELFLHSKGIISHREISLISLKNYKKKKKKKIAAEM